MGIGRREFLQIFGSLLATVSAAPSASVCLFDDVYLNRRFGIGFTKPLDWEFIDVREMGTMRSGQLLDVDNPRLSDSIMASFDLPFVAVKGRTISDESQTPCMQFYLATHPDQTDAETRMLSESLQNELGFEPVERPVVSFTNSMRKIRQDWQACREFLTEFRASELPTETEISCCDAAEYTASYLYEHVDLVEPRRIRVRTLAVEHHDRFYLIRLIDANDSPYDFSDLMSSLRLT